MRYLIYKITNSVNGKVYIGQTRQTVQRRWYQHVHDAYTRKRTKVKFHLAIVKHGEQVFNHEILKEGLTKEEASKYEIYYIQYFDSFKNGYNSTMGGDYFDGYTPIKGISHHASNRAIYTFYNPNGEVFTGSIWEISSMYNIDRRTLSKLVSPTCNLKSVLGWVIDIAFIPKNKRACKLKIQKSSNQVICGCGNRKEKLAKTCIKCRDTSGSNNGMYGKTQSKKAREAVSNRMRNIYADQTLRTWTHDLYGLEADIRTIDLRDKYTLNISALKKVTDRKANQHKGWRLAT